MTRHNLFVINDIDQRFRNGSLANGAHVEAIYIIPP